MPKFPLLSSFAFGLIGLTILSLLTFSPKETSKVALIFPPFSHGEHAFSNIINSGGDVIRFGAMDNIVIATFNNEKIHDIKRKTGAWFAIDADYVSACFKGD
jgi:hypothetical protein